jgi:hypothetical protein
VAELCLGNVEWKYSSKLGASKLHQDAVQLCWSKRSKPEVHGILSSHIRGGSSLKEDCILGRSCICLDIWLP